jgi:lipid A 3-O-deacylase
MGSDAYLRFSYDNDFFTATDRYYTQGIQLEIVAPAFKNAFYRKIFINPFPGKRISGLAVQHNAYTPTSITTDFILYGDRPYAATLMLQGFNMNIDSVKRRRFTTSLSIGVIGPHASGKWMQESIHRALDNVQPRGWNYQLKNDLLLNYRLNYEQSLLSVRNYFMLSALGTADIGSLNNKISLGFNMMSGIYNDPYTTHRSKKLSAYIYARPQISFVAYDASLQGGIFTENNIYSIPAKDIERLVFSGRAGIVFRVLGIYLEHFYAWSSPEFTGQTGFLWGGIGIGTSL